MKPTCAYKRDIQRELQRVPVRGRCVNGLFKRKRTLCP
jgi:hypothetical protein